MVKVPVSELRKFFSKATVIKGASTLPITEYIKLTCDGDTVTLVKTNLHSFIEYSVEGAEFMKNFTLLIDEKILSNAARDSEEEILKISFKEGKGEKPGSIVKIVTIEDGSMPESRHQSADETKFPKTPKYDHLDAFTLEPGMVEALYLSVACAKPEKEPKIPDMYVHLRNETKTDAKKKVEKSYICGYNGQVMYFKWFNSELPDMVLDQSICKSLGQYAESGVIMYRGDKYNFFDAGQTVYGFIQTEMKGPDFAMVVAQMKETQYFDIDRKQILAFCKHAIGTRALSLSDPSHFIDNGENSLLFLYEDEAMNRSCKKEIDIVKNKKYNIEKFLFNPEHMIAALGNVPFFQVRFVGPCMGNIYITSEDDKDYVGVVRATVITAEYLQQKQALKDGKDKK